MSPPLPHQPPLAEQGSHSTLSPSSTLPFLCCFLLLGVSASQRLTGCQCSLYQVCKADSGGSGDKESACSAGDPGSIPGSGGSLEKGMATHSSILAWKIPWTKEPGRLQSIESQRVRHDWVTKYNITHQKRKGIRKDWPKAKDSIIHDITSILDSKFLTKAWPRQRGTEN